MADDDEYDPTIDDGINWYGSEKITKANNILQLWGNKETMNLNSLILDNIKASPYFKNTLFQVHTYHAMLDEIYYNVNHLEPWEKGSRRMAGTSGARAMEVRGVSSGGIVSSAYCILFKLFCMKLTRKQVYGLINHADSCYIRGIGFLYIRYTQPPKDLWDWFYPYFEDEERVDPRAGGGDEMNMGQMCMMMVKKLDWYSTLFPRIPVPVQKQIEQNMREYYKSQTDAAPQSQQVVAADSSSSAGASRRHVEAAAADSSSIDHRSRNASRERSRDRSPRNLGRSHSRHRDDRRGRRSRDRDPARHSKSSSRRPSRSRSPRHRSRDRKRRSSKSRSRSRDRKSASKRDRRSRSRSKSHKHKHHRKDRKPSKSRSRSKSHSKSGKGPEPEKSESTRDRNESETSRGENAEADDLDKYDLTAFSNEAAPQMSENSGTEPPTLESKISVKVEDTAASAKNGDEEEADEGDLDKYDLTAISNENDGIKIENIPSSGHADVKTENVPDSLISNSKIADNCDENAKKDAVKEEKTDELAESDLSGLVEQSG